MFQVSIKYSPHFNGQVWPIFDQAVKSNCFMLSRSSVFFRLSPWLKP